MLKRNFVRGALIAAATVAYAGHANAACTVPNTISNGQVSDATTVMQNFNALRDCVAFRGALVARATDQTGVTYSSNRIINWDSETGGYDTDNIHDNSSNPSRLTVPAGVTKVRLVAHVYVEMAADNWLYVWLSKNASTSFTGLTAVTTQSNSIPQGINIISPVLSVTGGDYFEFSLQPQSGATATVKAAYSWAAMEIIE